MPILSQVQALQGAYAADTTAGKALSALASDLEARKLHAATRKQVEAMASDSSFEGSTLLRVLQDGVASLDESTNAPESESGNTKPSEGAQSTKGNG